MTSTERPDGSEHPAISRTDEYEEMAAAFQCAQIQLLDRVLRERGVDASLRRDICGDFTASFGVFLDQYWIESEAGRVFPVLGFATTHPDAAPSTIHLNNGAFSFSEYASGNLYWFYDEHADETEPQRMGIVGENGAAG